MKINRRQEYLIDEDGVGLVPSHAQRVALQLEVDGRVVVAHVGHVLDTLDPLRHHVCVPHRYQGHGDARHRSDVRTPHS